VVKILLAEFNLEERNEVGLNKGFGVGSFDRFVNEEESVVLLFLVRQFWSV